jgi:hypothetical protein
VASGYLDNLISTFGGTPEGPDPNRLEGLLELAREQIDQPGDELLGHVQRMQERIQQSAQERQAFLDARPGVLDTVVFGMIEANLSACRTLDESLQAFLDAPNTETLERLDLDARAFLQTCDRLSEMASSNVPICPGCGSQGPEPMCPHCEVDRLFPDPEGAERDFEQVQVNEEFMDVFNAYTKVVNGEGSLSEMMQALQPLEFTLLEAQALLQQAVDQDSEDTSLPPMLRVVETALDGVNRMIAVSENRSTRELHEGWAQVLGGASGLQRLMPRVPEAESESTPEPEPDE